jgi:hypothetical protein
MTAAERQRRHRLRHSKPKPKPEAGPTWDDVIALRRQLAEAKHRIKATPRMRAPAREPTELEAALRRKIAELRRENKQLRARLAEVGDDPRGT